MDRTIQAFIVMFILTAVAIAAGGPSIERGNELFNSALLGTNGKSCADCHPDGKGLEGVADYDENELAKITNQCIVKALSGKPLADGSLEMTSLVMYMNTVCTPKK